MDAREHWERGRLDDAIQAAIEDVKKKPGDATPRFLLAELSLFAGDHQRADRQLDAIVESDKNLMVHVASVRQLLRADAWRRETFTEGRLPEVLEKPDAELQTRLEALAALRSGEAAAARELLARADTERKRLRGTANGKAFDDFRDLDDLTAGVLEVLTTTGKYFWVPLHLVVRLEFEPISTLRDLYWRAVRIDVKNGLEGLVYLPVLYPGASEESDADLELGRSTEFRGEGPVRGAGQRMFLAGEDALPIGELESVEFDAS